MKHKKKIVTFFVCITLVAAGYKAITGFNLNTHHTVGDVIDSFDGVNVYFNGGVNHVSERHLAADGYNLGLKYQCVEFVKRYYYQVFNHKMPDSYGHAKDFFDATLASGALNPRRGLFQYRNGSGTLPGVGDLLVYKASALNRYGHVAIVTAVDQQQKYIEIIQQNAGPFSAPREQYALVFEQGIWQIQHARILGWLSVTDPAVPESGLEDARDTL